MLTRKTLPSINFEDEDIQRFEDNVAATLEPVLSTELIDGVLVKNLTIPASLVLTVPHGLGRRALGWIVVNANAATSNAYMVPTDQLSPNGSVVLRFTSGAGATISLWVF